MSIDGFWDKRVSAVWFNRDGVVPDIELAEWGEIEVVHPDGEVQRLYVETGPVRRGP